LLFGQIKKKYVDFIIQLHRHIERPTSRLVKESLQSSLEAQESMCMTKKKEFEYILERSTAQIPIEDSYGVKLKQFISDITELHEKNPKAKMLVFSQWHECLTHIAALLKLKDIKFVCLNTVPGLASPTKNRADRINVFKEDESVTVCLLDTARQATGLTLTVANYAFILDLVDDANERQAIGRIYRIGQTNEMFIHRYIYNEEAAFANRFVPTTNESEENNSSDVSMVDSSLDSIESKQEETLNQEDHIVDPSEEEMCLEIAEKWWN